MRTRAKVAIAVVVIIVAILATVGGLVYFYTQQYSQLRYELVEAKVQDVTIKPNLETVILAAAGDPIQAAISAIESIVLDLAVKIKNPGSLPVAIPSFDYVLYGNGVEIGSGQHPNSINVAAGSEQTVPIQQTIQVASLQPLVQSIISKNGNLELLIDGRIRLALLPIDIPFKKSKEVNVYELVQDKLKDRLQNLQARPNLSAPFREKLDSILSRLEASASTASPTPAPATTPGGAAITATPLIPRTPVIPRPTTTISPAPSAVATSLSLDQPPSTVSQGQIITFTGRLVRSDTGQGISGATIQIFGRTASGPTLLVSATTDQQGLYSAQWTVTRLGALRSFEAYATFQGTQVSGTTLAASQSSSYVVTVRLL